MSGPPEGPAWLANFRRAPDRTAALASYARLAARYEQTTLPIRHARQRYPLGTGYLAVGTVGGR